MPLKLVTGPANSAKAGVVLDAVRSARRRDPWLVVPTAADVAHFERELLTDAVPLRARVGTFADLAREVARRAGYAARTLSLVQRERLIAAAVADAPLDGELAAVAATPGFQRAALELVAELQRTLIAPGRFAAAVRDWPGATPAARAAAAIYGRYARAMERVGRVDAELFAWRALDALRADPAAWGDTPVFVYGFDDLTPLERDAIETLARIAGAEVTVSLTWERRRLAFAGRSGLAAELAQLATAGVDELPARDEHYAPESRRTLHHLERHLFEPGAPRVEAGDAVALLVAGGERAEAELVAAELLRALRDDGVAPEEVAVLMRSPARDGELLASVLDGYGVPCRLERRVELGRTALGRGLLALARCALRERDATAADLLAYLRTPGVLRRLELADRLELELRQRAVTDLAGARAVWEEARGGWPLREVDRLRAAAAEGPLALLAALEDQARALFAAPYRGDAPLLEPGEEADARALAALARALGELAELTRADPRSAPAADELPTALERLEVPVGASQAGGVTVADPLAIRARRFDTVIVCGLQAGELPRPPRPDPFLPDEDRRALNSASGLRLEVRVDPLADERFLFYAAVSRANRRLVLSCRDSDEEGNPALPSFFVDDVRALLRDLPTRHRPLSAVTWPLEQAPTDRERARAAALAAPRARSRPLAPLGERARAALRQREVLSAGALETYARCPVRWLVERELEPERFEPTPEPIARGSCIHQVLERTLRELPWPLDEAALATARRRVPEIVAEEAAGMVLGRGAAAQQAAAREIAADVLRLLEHEVRAAGGFAPAALELGFGMGDRGARERRGGDDADGGSEAGAEGAALGPLVLRSPGVPGELRLRGKIDRVDLDRAGRALVRDYKSGAPRREWPVAKWRAQDQLQVALYMLAVRELLAREPVGGLYQPLRGEDLRARGVVRDDVEVGDLAHPGDVRSCAELEAELEAAAARACELAARLRAGELTARPETCSTGGGCAYPGICRGVDQ